MLGVAVFLTTCRGQVAVEGTTPAEEAEGEPTADEMATATDETPEDEGGAEPIVLPEGPTVELTAAGMSIDGRSLPVQPSYDQFVELLGPPSYSSPRANIVHVYDELGIVMLQPTDRADIIEISFYFARMEIDFMPRERFNGTLTLMGRALNGAVRVDNLPRIYPDLTFNHEYILSTLVNPSVEVFFRGRTDGDKLGRVSVDFPH